MEFFSDSIIFENLKMCGVIMFIIGFLLNRFPSKKINPYRGYMFGSARKSQDHWKRAQIYSSKETMLWGLVLILLSIIGGLFKFERSMELGITAVLIIFAMILVYIRTEKDLRKHFPESA